MEPRIFLIRSNLRVLFAQARRDALIQVEFGVEERISVAVLRVTFLPDR